MTQLIGLLLSLPQQISLREYEDVMSFGQPKMLGYSVTSRVRTLPLEQFMQPSLGRRSEYDSETDVKRRVENLKKTIAKRRDRSVELYGYVLEPFGYSRVLRVWSSDPSIPGGLVSFSLTVATTSRQAEFVARNHLGDSYQSAMWPDVGMPELKGRESSRFGDRVWAVRSNREWSMISLIGPTMLDVRMCTAKYGKQPRVPLSDTQYKEWENYVADVVKRIRSVQAKKR